MEPNLCHQLCSNVNKGSLTHSPTWDGKYLRRGTPLPSFHPLIHVKQITLTSGITVAPVPAKLCTIHTEPFFPGKLQMV